MLHRPCWCVIAEEIIHVNFIVVARAMQPCSYLLNIVTSVRHIDHLVSPDIGIRCAG